MKKTQAPCISTKDPRTWVLKGDCSPLGMGVGGQETGWGVEVSEEAALGTREGLLLGGLVRGLAVGAGQVCFSGVRLCSATWW